MARSTPSAMASRSCSMASGGPRVITTESPLFASIRRTASSTPHSSCGLMVKPRCWVLIARAINTQHLGFTMSPHEECGVEEAVRLIEANKGDSVVMTLGPPEAIEQLRDAMALGVDRAIHLETDGQEWDAQATAGALLEAIRADEATNGPFDIIFFGNESADSGGFQVGLRVAYALGRPC